MLWGELRPDRPTDGLVEQVLGPLAPEPLERPLPRAPDGGGRPPRQQRLPQLRSAGQAIEAVAAKPQRVRVHAARSEEHTSELQSQSNLVCRLLLEKKKTKDSAP